MTSTIRIITVSTSRPYSRKAAVKHPDKEIDEGGDEPHRQRHPGAVDDADKQIAPSESLPRTKVLFLDGRSQSEAVPVIGNAALVNIFLQYFLASATETMVPRRPRQNRS